MHDGPDDQIMLGRRTVPAHPDRPRSTVSSRLLRTGLMRLLMEGPRRRGRLPVRVLRRLVEPGSLAAGASPDVSASEAGNPCPDVSAATCAARWEGGAGPSRDVGPWDAWLRSRPPVAQPGVDRCLVPRTGRSSPARIRRSGDRDGPAVRSARRPPRDDGSGPRRATRGVPWGEGGPGRRPRRRPSSLPPGRQVDDCLSCRSRSWRNWASSTPLRCHWLRASALTLSNRIPPAASGRLASCWIGRAMSASRPRPFSTTVTFLVIETFRSTIRVCST